MEHFIMLTQLSMLLALISTSVFLQLNKLEFLETSRIWNQEHFLEWLIQSIQIISHCLVKRLVKTYNSNYFVFLGPGTGLGHNSIVFVLECQVEYVADAIVKIVNLGAKSMVLKEEALKKYDDFFTKHMKGFLQ